MRPFWLQIFQIDLPDTSHNTRPICSHAAREVLKVGFL